MLPRAIFLLLIMFVCGCSVNRRVHEIADANAGVVAADTSAPEEPSLPTPTPLPPLPPTAPGPYIVFFDWDRDEITAQAAAILDNAARAYREVGIARVTITDSGSPQEVDPTLIQRRVSAARAYLVRQNVPVSVRLATGQWLRLVEMPDLRQPVPSPSTDPQYPRSGPRRPTRSSVRVTAAPAAADTGIPVPNSTLPRNWMTPTGTITRRAMDAMIGECIRLEGEVSADCQSAVSAGGGVFGAAPEAARVEFSFLLRSCLGRVEGEDCAQIVALDRDFRELPRGQLDPQPRTMVEGTRTLFTAFIRDALSQEQAGQPGFPIGEGPQAEEAASNRPRPTVVPFSRRMCFRLEAGEGDFRIVPVGDSCMSILPGGGRVRYNPQWYVTPLRAGTLELRLATDLYVDGVMREFRHEPYPLPIAVTPKTPLWDKIDNFIRRATATINLTAGLAEALGALFAAIAGWVIWSWFKKRKGSAG